MCCLIVSRSWIVIGWVHNAAIPTSHWVSCSCWSDILFLRIIAGTAWIVIDFINMLWFRDADCMLFLCLLELVMVGWWGLLNPVIYICSFWFAYFRASRFMSLSQSPCIVFWARTWIVSVRHLQDIFINDILLVFPLSESVKAGEVV